MALLAGGLCAFVAVTPAAGSTSALSLGPSIRIAGTGGAGNAAFWGGDPDAWANPALLGYHQGVRLDSGNTDFGTSSGLAFRTTRWSAAFGGIGVMGSGRPDPLGRAQLTDDSTPGTPGRIEQRLDSWGAGLSLAEAISSVMMLAGSSPPELFQRFDVAVGTARKHMTLDAAPDAASSARTTDYGALVRWTPVNTLDPRRFAPPAARPGTWNWPQAQDPRPRKVRARDPRAGIFPDLRPRKQPEPKRVDFAYGYSVQNAERAAIEHADGSSEAIARIVRHGVSVSMSKGRPRGFGSAQWLTRAFTPMYAAGIVGDLERIEPGDGSGRHDVQRYGVEVTYANILTLRHGRVKDDVAGIDGTTFGYSLGLDLGYVGGVRYDRARVPQASGLPDLERRGFTAWVDPLVMLRAARDRSRRR